MSHCSLFIYTAAPVRIRKAAITELLLCSKITVARPFKGCCPNTCFAWDKNEQITPEQNKDLSTQCTLDVRGFPAPEVNLCAKETEDNVRREEVLEGNICILAPINFTEFG